MSRDSGRFFKDRMGNMVCTCERNGFRLINVEVIRFWFHNVDVSAHKVGSTPNILTICFFINYRQS